MLKQVRRNIYSRWTKKRSAFSNNSWGYWSWN